MNVDLSRLASKARRITITLPGRIPPLVDEQAGSQSESRAGLLARAMLEYIEKNKAA